MEIKIEKQDGLKRKAHFTIVKGDLDKQYIKTLDKFQQDVKIDGFRKGKTPPSVIEKKYENELQGELKNTLAGLAIEKLEKEHNIKYAYQPYFEMDNVKSGVDYSFNCQFEIFPEFELIKFASFKIERPEDKVADKDIETNMQLIELDISAYAKTQAAAKELDRVEINLKNLTHQSENDQGENIIVQPGSNRHLKELETATLGLKTGDKKTLSLNLHNHPGHDHNDECEIEVLSVEERAPFEWNEDKYKLIDPKFSKLDEVKDYVRNYLLQMNKNKNMQDVRIKLKEALMAKLNFQLPEKVINQDIEENKKSNKDYTKLKQALEEAKNKNEKTIKIKLENTDEELSLKDAEAKISNLEQTIISQSTEHLRYSYYMSKIATEQKINARNDAVDYMFTDLSRQFGLDPESLIKESYGQRLYRNLQLEDINTQALNWNIESY